MPLVTRRLNARDCEPLIGTIIRRINNWSVKLLSYAGCLQLIQFVLFSLYNFLCRHFILPKGILKRITQLCARFLWKGNEKNAKGARVSWEKICYLKLKGGLGVQAILCWNRVCILQHIWAIIMQSGSL